MRVGCDGDIRALYPLFLGYPHLIRGYESASFRNSQDSRFGVNSLMGTRIAVVNLEIRLPFTGPEKLAVIRSGMLFSDLNLFFDAGLAWNSDSTVAFRSTHRLIETRPNAQPGQPDIEIYARLPTLSAGVSISFHLSVQMLLETYYAFP